MSTSIIPFTFEAHEIRAVEIGGAPWFVLADICQALGIRNARDISARLDEDMKGVDQIDTPGGRQSMTVVSEAGLYDVVIRSDKPKAAPFRRWVTTEVLPAIRQHGAYMTPSRIEEVLADPDTIIQLALQLKEARAEATREAKARLAMETYARDLEPRADNYDRFLSGDGTYSIGAAAKVLGLSQNKLFMELRNAGVLIAKGPMHNTPYQRYMHHFMVRAASFEHSDGTVGNRYTTRVQASGLDFIARKLGLPTRALPIEAGVPA